MDMKEKLVDILLQKPNKCTFEQLADFLIAHGVTVQEWISVTERLPDMQDEVLTYSECNGVRSACLLAADDEKSMWYLCRTDKLSIAVTHWMPLPQPPKGE